MSVNRPQESSYTATAIEPTSHPPSTARVPLQMNDQGSLFVEKAADAEVERENVYGKGPLRTFDVFSLIVNKMVGTGIYSAPSVVFLQTGNKSLTLGLYGVGFLYSLFSTFIYLDYANALPYTGGELVYLDEITGHSGRSAPVEDEDEDDAVQTMNGHDGATAGGAMFVHSTDATRSRTNSQVHHGASRNGNTPTRAAVRKQPAKPQLLRYLARWRRRFLGDGLLAYCVFSVIFIGVFNSGTNSMQAARLLLLCIQATDDDSEPDLNHHLVRFIGWVILTVLCLLQYFSPAIGRAVNRVLAVVKLMFLIVLIGFALAADGPSHGLTSEAPSRTDDWYTQYPVTSKLRFAKSFLVVLFSFEGWENATFVTGEIPPGRKNILRRGFIAAVVTVGTLYLVVTAVYLNSATGCSDINSFEECALKHSQFYASTLTPGNPKPARRAWALISFVSALGSLNAIIYTFSRVKQAIGDADILPWSKTWKKDDAIQRDTEMRRNAEESAANDPNEYVYKAPQGGLIIHWFMSVVVIAGSSSIRELSESVGLPGYVQTYVHCFVLMVLGAAFLRLEKRDQALQPQTPSAAAASYPRSSFLMSHVKSPFGRILVMIAIFVYVCTNLALLIINVIPPYVGTSGTDSSFDGWGFMVVLAGLVVFGIVYYVVVFGAVPRTYPARRAREAEADEHNGPAAARPRRVERGLFAPESGLSKLNLFRLVHVRAEIRKDDYYQLSQDYPSSGLERVYRFGRRWRIHYYLPDDEPPNAPSEFQRSTKIDGPVFFYWLFGGGRLIETPWQALKMWWTDVKVQGISFIGRKTIENPYNEGTAPSPPEPMQRVHTGVQGQQQEKVVSQAANPWLDD